MKQRKLIFWLSYHLGLLIFSFGVAMLMKYRQFGEALHPTVVVPIVSIFMMSVCIGYLAIFMVNRTNRYDRVRLNKMILPGLLIFYVSAFLISNLSITITVFGWYLYEGLDLSDFWHNLFRYELKFSSWRFFMWLLFFTVAFFYVLWRKTVVKEQKLQEENLKFRYRNLKSRVNPHFLFNSLNTLSEVVYEDAKKADEYIQKLSAIYRYVLENEEVDLVPLTEELNFVNQYFMLQKVRDNDKINLKINFPDPERYKIIPVSLQLLVENALKHNTVSYDKPLEINIFEEDDRIVVSNAIQRKSTLENSTGSGLSDLKERAKLITERELQVIESRNNFEVKLPLILV